MNQDKVEQLLKDCMKEVSQEIICHDSLDFLFHNIQPEFIISQLAKKLVEKENELAQLLF